MATENVPTNKSLWEKLKAKVRAKNKWPSHNASMQLTRLYKAKGGTFTIKDTSKKKG